MERIEQERKVIQESLKQSADETSSQLAITMAKNTDLQTDKEVGQRSIKGKVLIRQPLRLLWLLPWKRGRSKEECLWDSLSPCCYWYYILECINRWQGREEVRVQEGKLRCEQEQMPQHFKKIPVREYHYQIKSERVMKTDLVLFKCKYRLHGPDRMDACWWHSVVHGSLVDFNVNLR